MFEKSLLSKAGNTMHTGRYADDKNDFSNARYNQY